MLMTVSANLRLWVSAASAPASGGSAALSIEKRLSSRWPSEIEKHGMKNKYKVVFGLQTRLWNNVVPNELRIWMETWV